jgi:hypothetical protein
MLLYETYSLCFDRCRGGLECQDRICRDWPVAILIILANELRVPRAFPLDEATCSIDYSTNNYLTGLVTVYVFCEQERLSAGKKLSQLVNSRYDGFTGSVGRIQQKLHDFKQISNKLKARSSEVHQAIFDVEPIRMQEV